MSFRKAAYADKHVMLEGDRTVVADDVQLKPLPVQTSPSLGQRPFSTCLTTARNGAWYATRR